MPHTTKSTGRISLTVTFRPEVDVPLLEAACHGEPLSAAESNRKNGRSSANRGTTKLRRAGAGQMRGVTLARQPWGT